MESPILRAVNKLNNCLLGLACLAGMGPCDANKGGNGARQPKGNDEKRGKPGSGPAL